MRPSQYWTQSGRPLQRRAASGLTCATTSLREAPTRRPSFAYAPDRKGEHPGAHLQNFHGTLQADGFAAFNRLYETGTIVEAACWAHVRRKFHDLYEAHRSPIAEEALKRIGELYGIEQEIRGRPPDERRQIRNARARPLLESLKNWLEESLSKLSRKSDTTRAVHYAQGRWPALIRYADDGNLEIDNNAAERSLRADALGRKNYMFTGLDSGGERAAAMYTVSSARPSSTASIQRPIRPMCWHGSPTIRCAAPGTSCPGTWQLLLTARPFNPTDTSEVCPQIRFVDTLASTV